MALIEKRLILASTVVLVQLCLISCGFFSALSPPESKGSSDGPPSETMNPKKIKDAVPRVEKKSRGGNREVYSVFGKKYRVMSSSKGFTERGEASWYGKKFHGRLTANGERYNMYEMTAAHKHLPLPSYVEVKNLDNGKKIIVRVNDRGPFHGGRIIDLSYAAATKIGMLKKGVARVEITAINTKSWRKQQAATPVPLAAVPSPQSTAKSKTGLKPVAAKYYLQVGAFKSLSAAQKVQNKLLIQLAEEGEQALVVIHPTGSEQPIYRVRLGPFASRQLSQESLRGYQQKSVLDSFGKIHTVSD